MPFMNTTLHSVDPFLLKVSRSIETVARTVIEIYMGMLFAFMSGFLIILGAVIVLVGLWLPLQHQSSLSSSAFLVPIGLAWLLSAAVRRLTWIFLGFCVLWMIVLTGTLLPFLGEGKQPLPVQIILGVAYLLPPLVATGITLKYKTKC